MSRENTLVPLVSTMPDDNDEQAPSGLDDFPFSDNVLRLYRQARDASTKEERTAAMMELARLFAVEHDLTDFTATDDWHIYIEEFEKAKLAFEQAGLRLSRLVAHTLDEMMEENEVSADEIEARATRSLN